MGIYYFIVLNAGFLGASVFIQQNFLNSSLAPTELKLSHGSQVQSFLGANPCHFTK
jgi:hypothetical protein